MKYNEALYDLVKIHVERFNEFQNASRLILLNETRNTLDAMAMYSKYCANELISLLQSAGFSINEGNNQTGSVYNIWKQKKIYISNANDATEYVDHAIYCSYDAALSLQDLDADMRSTIENQKEKLKSFSGEMISDNKIRA